MLYSVSNELADLIPKHDWLNIHCEVTSSGLIAPPGRRDEKYGVPSEIPTAPGVSSTYGWHIACILEYLFLVGPPHMNYGWKLHG